MPSQVTNYICPNCGGPLHFDSEAQMLKCDFCGSEFTNEEAAALFDEKNAAAAAQGTETSAETQTVLQWTPEEAEHMRAYSCPSCGAQLICDENTAATSCPYCGNPTVVPAQFSGSLKPDYIIPFKLDKDEAVSRLKQFYKGKPFLPSAFTNGNHIQEIKGVYVPFWLYDGTVGAHMTYHGTRVHTYRSGDEQVTETDHYQIVRQGTVAFRHVPADASSKMPDDFMDSLEPFKYNDMMPFDMSYLPGYLADKYDVTAEEDSQRVEVRMRNSAESAIDGTVTGYASVVPELRNLNLRQDHISYAFFPIWILTTKWNSNNYMFAMNGQTGKMIGDDLPVDYMKFFLYFAGITLALMAVFGLLLMTR